MCCYCTNCGAKETDDKQQAKQRTTMFNPGSLTASLPLKNDGWKMILSFWDGVFSGASCSTSMEYICGSSVQVEVF